MPRYFFVAYTVVKSDREVPITQHHNRGIESANDAMFNLREVQAIISKDHDYKFVVVTNFVEMNEVDFRTMFDVPFAQSIPDYQIKA